MREDELEKKEARLSKAKKMFCVLMNECELDYTETCAFLGGTFGLLLPFGETKEEILESLVSFLGTFVETVKNSESMEIVKFKAK